MKAWLQMPGACILLIKILIRAERIDAKQRGNGW
jgi:hypothetical protein